MDLWRNVLFLFDLKGEFLFLKSNKIADIITLNFSKKTVAAFSSDDIDLLFMLIFN